MASAPAGVIGAALLVLGLAACSTPSAGQVMSSTVARAAAPPQRPGLLALGRDGGSCHLRLNSGATVTATVVAVNGTSESALCLDSDAHLTAGAIRVEGGMLRHGGALSAAPQVDEPATADWLAALSPPKPPAAACPGAACPDGTSFRARGTYLLLPGTYRQTINVNSNARVCIAPGSYVLQATWNLDASLKPDGSPGCPALQPGLGNTGVLLYFARGHVQCNSGGGFSLLRGMQQGRYRGLLYWQASRQVTAIDGTGCSGAGWYEPAGALILNSGARLSAPFVVAATVTVDARARLTVSGP